MVNQHDICNEEKKKSPLGLSMYQKGRRKKMIVANTEQKKRFLFNET
jgi:hypothetical protein